MVFVDSDQFKKFHDHSPHIFFRHVRMNPHWLANNVADGMPETPLLRHMTKPEP